MSLRITLALFACLLVSTSLAQDQDQDQNQNQTDGEKPTTAPVESSGPLDPFEMLLQEIEDLQITVDALRAVLAESKLESAVLHRELDELRQFIQDHHEFGRDFEQYKAIKATTERDAQSRRLQEAREQREARQAERTERQREFMERRSERDAQLQRVQGFRDAGFSPLGFDVFLSNTAFNYQTYDGMNARFDWNLLTGRFLRVYPFSNRIDFSSMTVSGSVMNTADEIRDLGIAVTFFDEAGSQVGGEIVQVNNARPQVPYPFTATIVMALDRPFTSASTYVLYADAAMPAPH